MAMENLIEAIQSRIEELKTEYIPAYMSIGPSGAFGIALMRSAIGAAEKAIANGDTVEMVRSLRQLRDFEL